MFKFLMGRAKATIVKETQRQTFERALGEVNEILATLDEKPTLRLDMSKGRIEVDLPDQMPDEALALPAPSAAEAISNDQLAEKAAA